MMTMYPIKISCKTQRIWGLFVKTNVAEEKKEMKDESRYSTIFLVGRLCMAREALITVWSIKFQYKP